MLANSPADMKLRHKASDQYRIELSQDVQDVLTKNEEARTNNSKGYNDAHGVFMQRNICRLPPFPLNS
jgi:hypothetical protein